MTEDTITAVSVIETRYGEKITLQSPFDAKDFIKALPFMAYGSYADYEQELRENDLPNGAVQAALDFDFSNDFATHRSWNPNAFGRDEGGWVVDKDSLAESFDFFEHCGFEVENNTGQ